MIMERGDYALDLFTPVRHAAVTIGAAAPAAVSIATMAASYKGFSTADFHRIKLHQKCATDAEAKEWLMEYATSKIMYRREGSRRVEQIIHENGGYRLADGVAFESLTYDGKPVGFPEPPDPHKTFRDPFNPQSGIFSQNIRAKGKDDLKELCESIAAMGYVEESGIVVDERGVVISGHRRLAALRKLGIEPPPGTVRTVKFGDGDAADIDRLKFAIALNTAQKPLNAKDRKRIAEYLYGTGEWSMPRIGELLKVDESTISYDLEGIPRTGIVIDSFGNRHRPRGSLASVKPAIFEELDAGASYAKIAAKFDVTKKTIWRFAQEKKLGGVLPDNADRTLPSSSKIPEDQRQAVFQLVDEGKSQIEAIAAITGKPVKTIPTGWRKAFNLREGEELGRRKLLAEMAQQQPVPQQQPTPQHQCICSRCGHVHNRED